MFIVLADNERLAKEKLEDYRREAEAYRQAKEANGRGTSYSTSFKVGLALIAVISLLAAASQFIMA